MADAARKIKFVDQQIRFSCSVPTDMIEKFKLFTRKQISPNMDRIQPPRELTKAQRIELGMDREGKHTTRPPMLEGYLKIPLGHANHPNEQQKQMSQLRGQGSSYLQL